MAQKVTSHLVDDLSGDVIEDGKGRTVQFAFDGSSYEIDLTDDNADNFREALSDYVAAARKVSGRNGRATSSGSTPKARSNPDDLAKFGSGRWRMVTRSPLVGGSAMKSATRTTLQTERRLNTL